MIFTPTNLPQAFLVEPEKKEDERGFFARSWCQKEFSEHKLNPSTVQCNISYNKKRGTLRGMHYQAPPFAETKLVRCTRGSLYDVIIDLRPSSPTYKGHFAEVLTSDNYKMLYVPEGFAHGFQTLEDDTEIFYQMSQFYSPSCARGVRYNDPAFGIEWPIGNPVMVERDRNYPDFQG
jgi:dTDP-4-dehydrorhamnose 3,5-epimerase